MVELSMRRLILLMLTQQIDQVAKVSGTSQEDIPFC